MATTESAVAIIALCVIITASYVSLMITIKEQLIWSEPFLKLQANSERAIASLQCNSGLGPTIGSIYFEETDDGKLHIYGKLINIPKSPTGQHGFHVHTFGDQSQGCASTGPHLNPLGKDHGAKEDTERHLGDLGNVPVTDFGEADIDMYDDMLKLGGDDSIIGRSIVVSSHHRLIDDLLIVSHF